MRLSVEVILNILLSDMTFGKIHEGIQGWKKRICLLTWLSPKKLVTGELKNPLN